MKKKSSDGFGQFIFHLYSTFPLTYLLGIQQIQHDMDLDAKEKPLSTATQTCLTNLSYIVKTQA
jgi:hypothetical protein